MREGDSRVAFRGALSSALLVARPGAIDATLVPMNTFWMALALAFGITGCSSGVDSGPGADAGSDAAVLSVDSGPRADAGSDGAVLSDGAAERGDAPVCDYSPSNNDPLCPASRSEQLASCGMACPKVGVECVYPGYGDVTMANGCTASAGMTCKGPGSPGVGSQLDGGAGWVCVQ
jgi:hypothetical protein